MGTQNDVKTNRQKRTYKKKQRSFSKKEVAEIKKIAENKIMAKAETKYVDANLSLGTDFSTPVFQNLSAPIGFGLQEGDRIGEEVRGSYLTVRGACIGNITGAQTVYWRMLVIRWLDNALENPPTIEDIFGNKVTGGPQVFSNYDPGERKSYQVLLDKKGLVSSNVNVHEHNHLIDEYIDLKHKTINWDNSQATTGHIWIVTWTSEPSAGVPAINVVTRLAYKDF